MAKTLRVAGLVWCVLAGLVVVASLVMLIVNKGLSEFWVVMSPFNIANYIVAAIMFAPGLLMLWGSDKLKQRRSR